MKDEQLKEHISRYVKEREEDRKTRLFGYFRVAAKEQLQGTPCLKTTKQDGR